ncbi:hypothetical protein Tco_1239057 [Tanacetum coccineum]
MEKEKSWCGSFVSQCRLGGGVAQRSSVDQDCRGTISIYRRIREEFVVLQSVLSETIQVLRSRVEYARERLETLDSLD